MNPQHLTLSSLAMDASQVSSIKGPKERDNIETDRLQKRTGYELTQKNGQRIYGGPPPNWYGPPPVKGTEIFVGKVPRDMYEWQLVPIFERCGKIYELRLMMDFSGSNRGYLFVRYTRREEAKLAIKELNNFEIKPGKFIGVIPSVDNRKLWISGIPKNRSAAEIQDEMSKLTDGVTNVYIYNSHLDKSKTRGYAFIEYETHRHAALARRKLVPGRNFLFDQEIERVDWAEPENEVDDDVMAKVKVLFIRNLSAQTSEDDIEKVFEECSEGQVERVKKTKDYAFVHFNTRDAAERAFKATKDDLLIDNCQIEVSWSKPIDRQLHNQRKQLTKVMTFGPSSMKEVATIPPMPAAMPNNYVTASQPLIMHNDMRLSNYATAPLIAPRTGGAAGIRGLGAPGTLPPRSLLRKLNALSMGGYQPQMNNGFYEEVADMMQRLSMTSAGGGERGCESFNSGVIPPGAPNSPPANGLNSPAFFGNNMRMIGSAPIPMQSPFFPYTGGW